MRKYASSIFTRFKIVPFEPRKYLPLHFEFYILLHLFIYRHLCWSVPNFALLISILSRYLRADLWLIIYKKSSLLMIESWNSLFERKNQFLFVFLKATSHKLLFYFIFWHWNFRSIFSIRQFLQFLGDIVLESSNCTRKYLHIEWNCRYFESNYLVIEWRLNISAIFIR